MVGPHGQKGSAGERNDGAIDGLVRPVVPPTPALLLAPDRLPEFLATIPELRDVRATDFNGDGLDDLLLIGGLFYGNSKKLPLFSLIPLKFPYK